MDPFLEIDPIFQELHSQMLSHAQRLLQPQLRPRYIARLERRLSEGSVWDNPSAAVSLAQEYSDLTVALAEEAAVQEERSAVLAQPTLRVQEELDEDELQLRKQRRIVIYVNDRPRQAVTTIELLTPSNKKAGTLAQARYLEKRASALHGGLHWMEIDLLRAGQRPPLPETIHQPFEYLTYVAQATPSGWSHLVYTWRLADQLPRLPVPLLGNDLAILDLAACFKEAYDAAAADDEANYEIAPPAPALSAQQTEWLDELLRRHGLR